MTEAQWTVLVGLLIEIRDRLTCLCEWSAPDESDGADADPRCDHPEGRRQDASTLRRTRWTCRDCGFEYDSAATLAPAFTPGADAKE